MKSGKLEKIDTPLELLKDEDGTFFELVNSLNESKKKEIIKTIKEKKDSFNENSSNIKENDIDQNTDNQNETSKLLNSDLWFYLFKIKVY